MAEIPDLSDSAAEDYEAVGESKSSFLKYEVYQYISLSVRTYGLIHSAVTDSAVCALGALCI
jgi:hypothetical protein